MQNYKNIFLLSFILIFQQQIVLGAAPALQLISGTEQDDLIHALLAGDAIEDVYKFWHTNVELPLAAEIDNLGIEIATMIARRIKENILVSFLPTAAIAQAVTDEIERLHADGADLVFSPLPPEIQAALRNLAFLHDEEEASLSFTYNDMLAQGEPNQEILDFIETIGTEYDETGAYKPIVIDTRIYGIEQGDVFIDHPVHVIPAPPIKLSTKAFKHMKRKMSTKFTRLRARNVAYTSPLPRSIYVVALADTDNAEATCSICATQECTLYKNVCPTCFDDSIALCESCITQLTVQTIVGNLTFSSTGDTGPVHIDFSLRLPRCSFCNEPYYDETNIQMLERALPIHKRRALVLEALTKELEKIPAPERPDILGRLIASSVPLQGIKTHRPSGTLLPLSWLALQIYERTAAMHENVREPFSNAAVWLK